MNKWIYLLPMRQVLTITKHYNTLHYNYKLYCKYASALLSFFPFAPSIRCFFFMAFASLHRSNHELGERAKTGMVVLSCWCCAVGVVLLVLCCWCCVVVVGVVLLVLWCWCCKVEIYISSPQTEVRYWQTRGRNITSNWKLLIGGRLYNFLFKLSFNFFSSTFVTKTKGHSNKAEPCLCMLS